MSTPIKIVVTAETAAAAAQLKQFASSSAAGLKVLEQAGGGADNALSTMRQSAMGLREGFHALEMGVYLLGGQKFPELAQAVLGVRSGMMLLRTASELTGKSMAALGPYAALVVAAVAAGTLVWKEWNAAEDEAAQKAKDLADAWKELPPLLEKINALQKQGLISDAAARQSKDMLEHPSNYFVDENGRVFASEKTPTHTVTKVVGATYSGPYGPPGSAGRIENVEEAYPRATAKQVQDFLANKNPLAPGPLPNITDEQLKASGELQDDIRKASEAAMSELDKKIAEIEDKRREANEKILKDLGLTEAQLGDSKYAGQKPVQDAQRAILQNNRAAELESIKAQQDAQDKLDKQKEEAAAKQKRLAEENARAYYEAYKKVYDALKEKEKQRQQDEDANLADLEAQLAGIKSNPRLTEQERAAQSLLVMNKLGLAYSSAIGADTAQLNHTTDPTARYDLEKRISSEKEKQARLANEIYEAQGRSGDFAQRWNFNWTAQLVQFKNQWQDLAVSLSTGAFRTITDGVRGIGSALTSVIMGSKTAAAAFAEMGTQLLQSFINMVLNALLYAYVAIPVLTALGVLTGGATAAQGSMVTTMAVSSAVAGVSGMVSRDSGGPGEAGMPYLIGRGAQPELFVPDTAGRFYPRGSYAAAQPAAMPAGGAGGSEIKIDHFVVNNEAELYAKMKSSTAQKIIVAHVYGSRNKLGLST